MPIRRRRSFSGMNLERGFLRLTFAVSLVFLVAGALVVGITGWEDRVAWNEATQPRTYDQPEVYVMHLGVVQFPPESTDQQIKDTLDRSAPSAIQKAMARATILRSLRSATRDYADLTDSELASKLLRDDPLKWSGLSDISIGVGLQVTLLPAVPPTAFRQAQGDQISHLYIGSSPNQASMLYTRGEAIKAAALSQARAVLVLRELASFYDSPRARPAPWSMARALVLVVVGAVALPWGLFFFLRWVARGFSGSSSESQRLMKP